MRRRRRRRTKHRFGGSLAGLVTQRARAEPERERERQDGRVRAYARGARHLAWLAGWLAGRAQSACCCRRRRRHRRVHISVRHVSRLSGSTSARCQQEEIDRARRPQTQMQMQTMLITQIDDDDDANAPPDAGPGLSGRVGGRASLLGDRGGPSCLARPLADGGASRWSLAADGRLPSSSLSRVWPPWKNARRRLRRRHGNAGTRPENHDAPVPLLASAAPTPSPAACSLTAFVQEV
jgi:hypothetical protein